MKLVDEVVPPGDLIAAAKKWITDGGSAQQPWDREGYRIPGGPVFSKPGMMTFPAANAIYRRETYDNYPGARAVLQCVYEGLQVSIDTGLRIESRYFANVLRSREAHAMIRTLFISMQELSKLARRPADVPPSSFKKIGVLGAGFMGAGIAQATAMAGMDVVLIDRDMKAAEKGKAGLEAGLAKLASRGALSEDARAALLSRIRPSADYGDLAGCDLVIEAVFEDPAVKKEVIEKAEAVIGEDCIFGSNTSTLPITGLAENAARPDNFIGIHFFSPVDRMVLVEIILGAKTGDAALARALDYCRAIRKTPIVVNDSRGFYTSRVVGTYVREGHLMLAEGVPAAMIENAGRMAGMPVGPLALNDEVAVDLAWKIVAATRKELGAKAVDPRQEKLLEEMVVKKQRLGRKNGKGFYDYPENGPKRLWPGLAELGGTPLDPDAIDVKEIEQRLLAIQALETVRCLEEKVLTDVREADVGSILGFGFAPFSGGTLSYIDGMGTAAFLALCMRFEKEYGARFAPCALLRDMARNNETFYGRFAPGRAARAA
jgi:3-hydroxyacyl-CoA dehydrogenase/enoyl-CoA hydratase/3-hydroxybutyryl-CoA epimerase